MHDTESSLSPNHRGFRGGPAWLKTWILALSIFGAAISCLELQGRRDGICPSVGESKDVWYFWRNRANREDGRAIVLLGTSRVLADFSIETLQANLPGYAVVQLGISGAASPVGILRSLLADPHFKGTVICELDTPLLTPSRRNDFRGYVNYRPTSPATHLDLLARAGMSDLLIVRQWEFTFRGFIERCLSDQPERDRAIARANFRRQVFYDFASATDIEAMRRNETAAFEVSYKFYHSPSWNSLASEIRDLNLLVDRFRERGGRIVFLRAPSTGERWNLEERFHSKKESWDRFAALSSGLCLHFRDVASLSKFECPDDSHLDYRDAPAFTRALILELRRKGAIP